MPAKRALFKGSGPQRRKKTKCNMTGTVARFHGQLASGDPFTTHPTVNLDAQKHTRKKNGNGAVRLACSPSAAKYRVTHATSSHGRWPCWQAKEIRCFSVQHSTTTCGSTSADYLLGDSWKTKKDNRRSLRPESALHSPRPPRSRATHDVFCGLFSWNS